MIANEIGTRRVSPTAPAAEARNISFGRLLRGNAGHLLEKAWKPAAQANGRMRIVYMESFDHSNALNPIDDIRYYMILGELKCILEKHGIDVEAAVHIADIGVTYNIGSFDIYSSKTTVKPHSSIAEAANARALFAHAVAETFGYSYEVILESSDINRDPDAFSSRLSAFRSVCYGDRKAMEALAATVPPSKREQESATGYTYSLAQLALMHDWNLKLGPPRERYYDRAFNAISVASGSRRILPIYGMPTYPFVRNSGIYEKYPDIRINGVVPYVLDTSGNSGSRKFRITVGGMATERIESLIMKAYVSPDGIVNPVLDIAQLAAMAKSRLLHGSILPKGLDGLCAMWEKEELSEESLRGIAFKEAIEYVVMPVEETLAKLQRS